MSLTAKYQNDLADECVALILSGDEKWARVLGPLDIRDAFSVMGLAFGKLVNMVAEKVDG